MPRWRRLGWVRGLSLEVGYAQITASDTYDIYYANPNLLPPRKAQPAEYPPGEVWRLNDRRGDATVEDICEFIVEFINSDVMVRLTSYGMVVVVPISD